MSLFTVPDRVINFERDMPIELSYKNSATYKSTSNYDHKLMTKGFVWHQIIVEHKGKFRKPQILLAIFEAIKGEEFFPIAYEEGDKRDTFLVRQCKPALDNLFQQGLNIRAPNNSTIILIVRLNIADYKEGQISPYEKIAKALDDLYRNTETVKDESGILNLSHFGMHREFRQIVINLGNRCVFQRICESIFRNEQKFRGINGLILKNNEISTLSPLTIFKGCEFAVLDLRHNKIRSQSRICVELKEIKAGELLLAGNPITQIKGYPLCIKEIFTNFLKLDGLLVKNLSQDYTPIDYEVDITCDGVRIDETNREDISNYQHCSEWHAIAIYDPDEVYTKDEILNAFFSAISPTLSEVYPCYYKYSSGEHKFLLRHCYDQLKWLIDNCDFKLTIRSANPIEDNLFDGENQNRVVSFYLRMCVGSHQSGQIDPDKAIDKALSECFTPMDRLLNLENFRSVKGLENIIINLGNEKILKRVLHQAGRKYLRNVSELRLGRNKINTGNFPKALAFMSNLKVLDLGFNEIQKIDDLKPLENIGIKSLVLDGNPLCRNYTFSSEYLRDVKKLFPELTSLDGVNIASQNALSSQKNFICDINAYDLVEQFVSNYFETFETLGGLSMKEMYHPKAILSFGCHFSSKQIANSQRIDRYIKNARNILKIKDFSRAFTTLFFGPEEISLTLSQLPKMQFDMQSFKTDTIFHNAKMTVITVNGVFLDVGRTVLEANLTFGFTRTFILKPVQRNIGPLKCSTEYQITNEQFTILSPTDWQVRNSFIHFKNDDSKKKEEMSSSDKENFLIMFQELTKLKSIWCTRCMEDGNWDFRTALEVFTSLCKENEIPETAFM